MPEALLISAIIAKGDTLPFSPFLESSSPLIYILTLTISTGWMTLVAKQPEKPPITKGEIVFQRLDVGAAGFGAEGAACW